MVVSPLLALMRDQVSRLPPGLPGAMLQGAMTRQQVDDVMQRAADGTLRLLLLGPEKLASAAVMGVLRSLPRIPLVVVDEAHCVAEWGHSVRPASFRLGHLLQHVLKPAAVLALTATATAPTRECICRLLAVPAAGVLLDAPMRDNLRLRVEHINGGSRGGEIASRIVTLITRGGFNALPVLLPAIFSAELPRNAPAASMPVCLCTYAAHASWIRRRARVRLKRRGVRGLQGRRRQPGTAAGPCRNRRSSLPRGEKPGTARGGAGARLCCPSPCHCSPEPALLIKWSFGRGVEPQASVRKARVGVAWHAECGMPVTPNRITSTTQAAFLANRLRVVVATVAFGMVRTALR